MRFTGTIITYFLFCSVLLLEVLYIFIPQPLDREQSNFATTGLKKDSKIPRDKLLGGLLNAEFDESSCQSRYQSSLYRKPSPYKASQYLISKLRSYEMKHKQCGPDTEAYKRSVKQLEHDNLTSSSGELCQYIVWIPMSGLGNRVLSLVSVFLYALLTERIILVDQRNDIRDLLCEPFPGTSWLLPLDFPLTDQLDRFHWRTPRSYGNMLKHHFINYSSTERFPSYLYLHLVHDYRDYDQMFFCEADQSLIRKVTWLIVKSDNYFIPSLWLIPSFNSELSKLFPQKDTIFHHLGRYLIHPTNQVWGLVYRFYNAYLSRADETLGIQVRVLHQAAFHRLVMDQIVSCTQREKLLSLTDNIVTSAWSTFGYVAQGLGGLKPWILYKEENKTNTAPPDPPCARAISMEPCFHAPPSNHCKGDTGKIVPFVRPCEDKILGIKVFDYPEDL